MPQGKRPPVEVMGSAWPVVVRAGGWLDGAP
jgi:hypothetical protein